MSNTDGLLKNYKCFFHNLFPNGTLISAQQMAQLWIFFYYRLMIPTHVSKVAPNWDLWRTLHRLSNSAVLDYIFLLNYRHGPPGGRPRQSRFLFQSGTELDNSTRLEDRHSTQCHRFEPPKDFFVIGHSGGDPLKHCENTLEATRLLYFINLFEWLKRHSSWEV